MIPALAFPVVPPTSQRTPIHIRPRNRQRLLNVLLPGYSKPKPTPAHQDVRNASRRPRPPRAPPSLVVCSMSIHSPVSWFFRTSGIRLWWFSPRIWMRSAQLRRIIQGPVGRESPRGRELSMISRRLERCIARWLLPLMVEITTYNEHRGERENVTCLSAMTALK